MAHLTVQDLINTIQQAAEDLLAAGGSDGMVSRDDLHKILAKREGIQRGLLEAFYDLLRDEGQPYMRVTRAVVADGVAFVKEKLIPQFEIMPGGLSEAESAAMQTLGAEAAALGGILKQAAHSENYLTAQQVYEQIAQNTDGLFFDYLGSEGSQPLEAVRIPGNVTELNKNTFAETLHLNQNDPLEYIERFVSAEPFFIKFICQHYQFELDDKATAVADLMRNNLRQNSIFVVGKDYDPNVPPQHPAYIVGIADDGSLVGFKSLVIWT